MLPQAAIFIEASLAGYFISPQIAIEYSWLPGGLVEHLLDLCDRLRLKSTFLPVDSLKLTQPLFVSALSEAMYWESMVVRMEAWKGMTRS